MVAAFVIAWQFTWNNNSCYQDETWYTERNIDRTEKALWMLFNLLCAERPHKKALVIDICRTGIESTGTINLFDCIIIWSFQMFQLESQQIYCVLIGVIAGGRTARALIHCDCWCKMSLLPLRETGAVLQVIIVSVKAVARWRPPAKQKACTPLLFGSPVWSWNVHWLPFIWQCNWNHCPKKRSTKKHKKITNRMNSFFLVFPNCLQAVVGEAHTSKWLLV